MMYHSSVWRRSLLALACCATSSVVFAAPLPSVEALGQALYFDQNLSAQRTQSCSTCHAPEAGFADPRDNAYAGAVSVGADGVSIGDRHSPSAAYASFSPPFQRLKSGEYVGGQFHDGRASSLKDQAAGPPLNPVEMAMPSKKGILERLKENPSYIESFEKHFGNTALQSADAAYEAMISSIAAFEKTELFAPFDSRYDRYLRGEYKMTEQEELGRTLFFSAQFTNCNQCHQLKRLPGQAGETFTNYQYRNIGVPVNKQVRLANGKGLDYIDAGLLDNPAVSDSAERGKFKTPTLRNVALTAPYMHNGVFQDLKTVVLFYDKYNSRKAKRQINPETGEAWGAPEVAETVALKELEKGGALSDKRINALIAFMKTLTDKRYEHLVYAKEEKQ